MPTQFQVSEESLGHHYSVVMTDDHGGEHHFYIENAPGASKKPDLTFYDGADCTGPLIGLSKFPRITSNCEVRLIGEQLTENWVSVTKKGFMSKKYTFRIPVGHTQGLFTWKKTRSMGRGSSPYGNMKLIDEQSHDVLAVFSSDPFSIVTGRLDMCQDQGDSFDRWALITGMAVREKQRRHTIDAVRSRDSMYAVGAIGGLGMGGMGAMGGGGGC